MARIPSRKVLQDMKRTDIQKLCKVGSNGSAIRSRGLRVNYAQDYGVRANLKTDALIDLLLDSTK